MYKHLKVLGAVALLFSSVLLVAQNPVQYQPEEVTLQTAKALFYKKKYAAAQKVFEQVLANEATGNTETAIAAQYYQAVCALQLFNRDAEYLLKDFLKKYPDSRWKQAIYYQLGTYSYRKKDHRDVVQWLSKVAPGKLESDAERVAYYFKLGFSNFHLGNAQEALASFARIKDVQGDYFYPANYYYAHLNYESGRYENALSSFNRIKDDSNFSELVKYYIVHIYYQQKKYEELLAYAEPLLADEDLLRREEISRLVGEAYYYEQDYEKALPYLEDFSNSGAGRSQEDNYQLGYCYLKTGNYGQAVKYFNYLTNAEGLLGQTANYLLAQAYLKLDEKKMARSAFRAASKEAFDREIKEDALFNYAKLAYELSFNPYHEAISAFEEYLNTYPNSPRVDEVNEILIYVYLTTRNYEAALNSIEKIQNKDFRLRSAYQYLAYNRGVELFLAKDYNKALESFQKVKQFQIEKKLVSESLFWVGECYYKLADYPRAVRNYSAYLKRGDAYGTGYYHQALYNLGYANFKQQNFIAAQKYFRDFVTGNPQVPTPLLADGYTRTADCFYIQKDFVSAADFYKRASQVAGKESDYATFQLAMCQGFRDKNAEKVQVLENFETRFPESTYAQDAIYERGDAYFKQGENDKALASFNKLVSNYPNGVWAKKGLMKSGLIFYRNKQVDEALATFKRVAENYPSYKESKEAIQRAEDIYVELGRIEEYNNWVQSLTYANISTAALDSVNYRAAENFFTKNDCEGAIDAFEVYLNRFDTAIFAVNAHFYMAECYFQAENYDLAKENYEYIADQENNKFTEPSLITVAYLNYLDSNYQKALEQYQRLEKIASFKTNRIEAKIGQMRCYNKLDLARETMDYANKVLFYSNIPEDKRIEAMLLKAKSEERLGKLQEAMNSYDTLANYTKSIEGAEARFRMAKLSYTQGEYAKAEELIFEAINTKPTYDDWLARTFILLSDVYIKMEDLFQAKATLQSIIDYHEGEDLVNKAKEKLDVILAMEAAENEGESEEVEIQFSPEDAQYEKLYEEEADSTSSATPAPSDSTALPKPQVKMNTDTVTTNP